MRRTALVGLALLLSSVALAQKGVAVVPRETVRTERPKRWAILIGVDKYDDEIGIGSLKYCAADMKLLSRVLTGPGGGFDPRNVLLMTRESPKGRTPTYSNIMNMLHVWLADVKESDDVLIAFSGHGVAERGQVYLLPSNAKSATLRWTSVKLSYVRDKLAECRARRKILILDACHSGAGKSAGKMSPDFLKALGEGKGFVRLASCGEKQKSSEDPHLVSEVSKGHGVFTYYLVEGLRGEADRDGDGRIDVDEAYRYADRETRAWARRKGVRQTPWKFSRMTGDMTVAYRLGVGSRGAETTAFKRAWGAGLVASRCHNYDEAVWHFRRAVGVTPHRSKKLLALKECAQVRMRQRSYDRAERVYKEALVLASSAPERLGLLRALSEVRCRQRDYEGALVCLREILKVAKGMRSGRPTTNIAGTTLLLMANTYRRQGDSVRAEETLRQVLSLPGASGAMKRSAERSLAQWGLPSRKRKGPRTPMSRRRGPAIPRGWTSEPKRVRAMTPKGEEQKDITYCKNPLGMEFVKIPAGECQMGSERGDSDEKPVHRVRVPKPLYMQAHEVTQRQWEQVMGNNPSHFKGASRPVEEVSWQDAQEFIRKLCAKEHVAKGTYRLPTEAEWEYACRAGSRTRFYSGDDESSLGRIAWYSRNSNGQTHEVGQKLANAFGLYDMSGNVREWCQDWYDSGYYAKSPPEAPGPGSGSGRVRRGGCWGDLSGRCRSAGRFRYSPGDRNRSMGFRLARTSK